MSTPKFLDRIIKGKIPLDFNWNADFCPGVPLPQKIPVEPTAGQLQKVVIDDEGLRDGLHGVPEYPKIEDMMRYINIASLMGITVMTVGIYSGDGVVDRTIKNLLKLMHLEYPHISPIVLSMACSESLDWAKECAQLNPNLQVIVFMGSAPSRLLAEGWTKKYVLEKLEWAVKTAVQKHRLTVIGATEHTTQTPPDFLKDIIRVQVASGAKYFCIADTIGIARPIGAYRITRYVRQILNKIGARKVVIDWHGHSDIGMASNNAMTSITAGATRVHLVPWGIGERAGNSSMEVFIINASRILQEKGLRGPWHLPKLSELIELYAEITGNKIPYCGCLGSSAFSTSLGIHTSAMLKAEELAAQAKDKNLTDLAKKLKKMARTVYASIDPQEIGREYQIGIGPWSGASTVKLWAIVNHRQMPSQTKIKRVLETAKRLRRILSEKEIFSLIGGNGIKIS